MSHAFALGRSQAGNVSNHRFFHVVPVEFGGFRFLRPPDLAYHHHRVGLRILFKPYQVVLEGTAVDGVAADADTGGYPDSQRFHLRSSLVSQGAGTADNAYPARYVDMARHDTQHGLAGADRAGTVGPGQQHLVFHPVAAHIALHPDHVVCGDTVGDTDTILYAGVRGFHDAVGGKRRRNENDTAVGAGLGYRILDRVKHGPIQVPGPPLAGGNATDNIGAVTDHVPGMEGADLAGKALDYDLCFFVY